MLPSPVSLVGMAMNLAINVCFGLTGTKLGAMHHGKLMAGTVIFSLVDFFVQVFLGGSGTAEPEMVGITSDELKDDLDTLRGQIAEDLFQELKSDKLAAMQTIEQDWKEAWDAAALAQKSGTGNPVVDRRLDHDWQSYYDSFKSECSKPTTVELCNWLALHDSYKYQTLSLYMLAAGLYLNICQLCLLIEFNDIMNDASKPGSKYETDFLHWVDVELPAWEKQHAAWEAQQKQAFAAANPGFGPHGRAVGIVANDPGPGQPEPARPRPPAIPPHCFDELTTSVFANHIRAKVKLFIAYADPIVTDLEAKVVKRNADLLQRTSAITVKADSQPGFGRVVDSFTGTTHDVFPRFQAELQKEIEIGMVRAGQHASLDPALQAVTDKDVKDFRTIVDRWRETQKNYALPVTG